MHMRTWRWARTCLITGGIWLLGLAAAVAQPLSDDCRSRLGDSKIALDTRKAEIESKLKALRDKLGETPAQEPKANDVVRDLRKAQEDLLEVLFATDCLRFQAPPLPAPPPAPAATKVRERLKAAAPAPVTSRGVQAPSPGSGPPPKVAPGADAVEITTYYATNRKRGAAGAAPAETFGNDGVGELTFGRTTVSIPRSHTAGTIELPQLWKFERTADPSKHFVLKAVTPMPTDAARAELAERLKTSAERSMLLYVHGYNMGFQDAALRTAQLAYDLQFPGVAFFYSWPSANRIRGYLQDEETARLCESVFESVVDQVSSLPVDAIYIVAHSMGNRIVGHGLQAYIDKGKSTAHIKELLLAAPDVNADLFKSTIAPRLAQMRGTRTTIYASSSDLALMASKVVHGFRRVGESSGGVLVFNGMDTVDASNASPSMRNLGHSYLVDSTSVLKDLHAIIASKLAARARGLTQMGVAPETYWQLPQ